MESYASNSIRWRVVPPPPPIQFDEGPEYEVEAILDSKVVKNKVYYFVDSLGYTPADRTWEQAENLKNTKELVVEFHHQYPISQLLVPALRLVELVVKGSVEIQAQHWPDRLKKPRTGSVGTDRLGRGPSRLGPIG